MLIHMRAAMRVHAAVRACACARIKTRPNDIPRGYTELCFPKRAILSLCRNAALRYHLACYTCVIVECAVNLAQSARTQSDH